MAFAAREIHQFEENENCIFCHRNTVDEFRLGKIFKYKNVTVHYFCLLFASHLPQNGNDKRGILGFLIHDIEKELRNKANSICTYCGKLGAVSVCATKGCKVKFHFPCGIRNLTFHLFCGEFQSFCFSHRKFPVPSICTESTVSSICVICQNDIQPVPCISNVWASCCKTAWFHKDCVQRLALNAGYFFKCPNCNNKNAFRSEMLQCGIYIPDQDASWELEPNSFSDLTERHNSCDARICFNVNGRKFSQSRGLWKIILCNTCGSQGVHIYCAQHQLKKEEEEWTCDVCSLVVHEKCTTKKKLARSANVQNISSLRISLSPIIADRTPRPRNVSKVSSHNLPAANLETIRRRGQNHLLSIPRVSLAEPKTGRMKNQSHSSIDENWKKKRTKAREIVKKKIQKSRRTKYTIDGTEVRISSECKQLLKNFHIDVSFRCINSHLSHLFYGN